MQIYKEFIFPTSLYSYNLKLNNNIIDILLKDMYNIKKEEESIERSNKGGYHSPSDLNNRNITSFNTLSKEILEIANKDIIKEYTYIQNQQCKKMLEMWFIINNKNDFNTIHTHARSWLSGTYYIKLPEKQKNFLVFEDPQPVRKYENLNYNNYGKEVFENMLILFPGWLAHKVPENTTEEERIVISFNLDYPTF